MANEEYIEDELGHQLIDEVLKFINVRKVKKVIQEKPPHIKKHEVLNFKGVKHLTFVKFFEENFPILKWGTTNEFFGSIKETEAWFRSQYDWNSTEFFYTRKHKIVPLMYRVERSRYDKNFITDFFLYFDPPPTAFRGIENFGDKDLQLDEFTLIIEDDLILYYDTDDLIFYLNPKKHLEENNNNPFYLILRLLAGYKKKSGDKNKIHIVYRGDLGFDKMAFDVKKVDIDVNLNYNDGFTEISESIIKNLNDKKKTGLYILSGETGTGKTSFIRYLAGKVKRDIIFVSPDMVNYITDPSFIPFLMNNSNSVLIIEDAEPALQKRDGGSRTGAISNILNLTDGLLSDCLNISIVATFNTKTKVLDEALLRKGRLVKSYSFERLAADKSIKLLEKLGHKGISVSQDMTLSEIYFYGEDNKKDQYNKNKIGF